MKITDVSMWSYLRNKARDAFRSDALHPVQAVMPFQRNPQQTDELSDLSATGLAPLTDTLMQLRQARDHYREIYDFSPVGFATFTRLGNFLDLNLALASLLGDERERIRGKSFSSWLAKGQLKYFIRHLNAVFLTRQKQSVELLLRGEGNHHRVIRLESLVVTTSAGASTACNSVVLDAAQSRRVDMTQLDACQKFERQLTEKTHHLHQTLNELDQQISAHRLTQTLVNESEEKYRLLFSSITDAVILYERDTLSIIDGNESALRLYGYSLEEMRGMKFNDLRFISRPGGQAWSAEQADRPTQIWHKTREGTPFPVELKTGSFQWEGRTVIFAFARNACERAVIEGRVRLAAQVFDCANESIVVADADYRVFMINPAFVRTTGYGVEDVLGRDLRSLLSDTPDSEAISVGRGIAGERSRYGRENLHRHKSGYLYHAWENHCVVRDMDGSVVYHVLVFSDISQLKSEEKKSFHLAHHDSLTGLPNRLLFNARLEQSLQLAKRHQTHLALLFLDLDRFKFINDSFGHDCGDLLLREIAARIRNCVREQDTVARLGGDEFVILLSEINHEQEAANLADKILRAVHQPVMLDRREVTTSASIGISLFPRDASTPAELVKSADTAMYCAKERGRHKYEFFTRELTLRAEKRAQMELTIRDNLTSGGFYLSYQPQFDLASGRMVGVEALLRWQPSLGMEFCPEKVIAIAEESSLILDLDLWVLRSACEQAARWHRSGLPPLTVAINFSAVNLMRENFPGKVRRVLDEFELPAEYIQLEVTESILHPGSRAVEVLESLKSLGVSLAIDDFGKGYSSLSTLRDLPIDRIKIDKSFIDTVPENKGDAGVARALIAMAHNMNMKITAEGVERDSQWHFLRSIGCDEGQGFRFGEPSTAASIPAYFDKVITLHGMDGMRELA